MSLPHDVLGLGGIADARDLALFDLLSEALDDAFVLVLGDFELHGLAARLVSVAVLAGLRVEGGLQRAASGVVVFGLYLYAVHFAVRAILGVVPSDHLSIHSEEEVD